MKTKTKALDEIIKSKKFDWVNSNITSDLFPKQEIRGNEYKLFNFDKSISSEDAIKEMEEEGYLPANIYELLDFNWNETDWVVALGSVGGVGGVCRVPYLVRNDSERDLNLIWLDGDWNSRCRFLAVRNSSLNSSETSNELGGLETLTLEKAIEICKQNGLTVTKTY